MKISDRVILPLVGSAFQPGKAAEAIEKIEDKELAQIAQGEYYFFSAQAEKCVETVKDYLDHDDVMLRLSADMLYTFANLTLGDPQAAQRTREDVHQCLTQAMQENAPVNVKAACLFAFYVISIFLHIPPEEGTPPLQQYIPYLPIGQRLFAVSLLAHEIYLRQDYAKAKGVVQGAFLMADGVYPISMIYLGCVQAMCQINLKEQEEAIQTVSQAWEWARFDKFMEPCIEYHGLLQGVLEVCIRKKEPEMYKKLVDGVLAFSRGWMKIHNPKMQKAVTDLLSPLDPADLSRCRAQRHFQIFRFDSFCGNVSCTDYFSIYRNGRKFGLSLDEAKVIYDWSGSKKRQMLSRQKNKRHQDAPCFYPLVKNHRRNSSSFREHAILQTR